MKIRRFAMLLLLLPAVLLLSCSNDSGHSNNDDPMVPPALEAEWTVLFFGAGKTSADILDNGQSRMIASLQGLCSVYPNDRIRCLSLLGTTVGDPQCRFLELEFQPNEIGNELNAIELGNWGERDMSSPLLLQQFVDSAIQRSPADHYMLVIGGEGDGWKGSCRDEISGNGQVLPHSELDEAIQNVVTPGGPFHVDLLVWLTPGMGNLEIAYEFSNAADYVILAPSVAQQPGFLALEQWYLDLNLDPVMSAERLGQFIVSRMQQKAMASHDSLATFDLIDVSQMPALSDAVDHLSTELTAALPAKGAAILTLWQELWDVRTDDSSTVDLKSFVRALQVDPSFADHEAVRSAAMDVENALAQVAIYQRTTRADRNRDGVMIYAPLAANEEELSQYNTLRLTQERSSWQGFLTALQASGTDLCDFTGQISWAGQTLRDLYLFLNTARTGAPLVYLTTPANITNTISPSQVEFRSQFALPDPEADCYIGAFQDIDFSGTLTPGDRYGYYHLSHPLRDWLTLQSGEVRDSITIVLTNTY